MKFASGLMLGVHTAVALDCAGTAHYQFEFMGDWSAGNQPQNYPENAHWSPPVIASHSGDAYIFKAGELVSPGMKVVAETGNPTLLLQELGGDNNVKQALKVGSAAIYPGTGGASAGDLLAFDSDNVHLGVVSMIAPSPDWFAGHTVNMCDHATGMWKPLVEFNMLAYDAGTDVGVDYVSANAAANPFQPVSMITPQSEPGSFSSYAPGAVPRFAMAKMELAEVIAEPCDGYCKGATKCMAGKCVADCGAQDGCCSDSAGCDLQSAVATCVCSFDTFCCSSSGMWDMQCAHEAQAACGLTC